MAWAEDSRTVVHRAAGSAVAHHRDRPTAPAGEVHSPGWRGTASRSGASSAASGRNCRQPSTPSRQSSATGRFCDRLLSLRYLAESSLELLAQYRQNPYVDEGKKVQLLACIFTEGLGWVATTFLALLSPGRIRPIPRSPASIDALAPVHHILLQDYGYRLAWQLNPKRTCFEWHRVASSSPITDERERLLAVVNFILFRSRGTRKGHRLLNGRVSVSCPDLHGVWWLRLIGRLLQQSSKPANG